MSSPRDYLTQLNSSVIHLGLDPVRKLLASLHNPQDAYASVLIAGTNGKGSIAAMLASILGEVGYRVGLYTSPHLVQLEERIKVNGEMIDGKTLDGLIEEIRGQLQGEGALTYFEFLTAVAFLHFLRRQVDVAVLEVGLGGRLDATNVVTPLVSVISNISLEHKEYLGNRLADIAREKGGIIKAGGLCITAAKQKQVLQVLGEICRERKAQLYQLGRHIRLRRHRNGTFSYYGIGKKYGGLSLSLVGRHQMENAALALAVVEELARRGFPVDAGSIARGLKKTRWEGRLEVLQDAPQLILDGGHNPAGIAVLCRALREDFSYKRLILVFAVMGDKDFPLMLKKIAPLADRIIITKPETERAAAPAKLKEIAGLYCRNVEIREPVGEALRLALAVAHKEDLICVTGSLYLVGEVKKEKAILDFKF